MPRKKAARRASPKVSRARGRASQRFLLRLFITGLTPRSQRAVKNLRELCDRHLNGKYDLEIIDVYQQPQLARDEQIIAAPTLLKKLPMPLRRILGDLSSPGKVLIALGLQPGEAEPKQTQSTRSRDHKM